MCFDEIYDHDWDNKNLTEEEIEMFKEWATRTNLGDIEYKVLPGLSTPLEERKSKRSKKWKASTTPRFGSNDGKKTEN